MNNGALKSPGMMRVNENEKNTINQVPKFLMDIKQYLGRGQEMKILTRRNYSIITGFYVSMEGPQHPGRTITIRKFIKTIMNII